MRRTDEDTAKFRKLVEQREREAAKHRSRSAATGGFSGDRDMANQSAVWAREAENEVCGAAHAPRPASVDTEFGA